MIVVDSRESSNTNVADAETGQAVAVERLILHALIKGHGYDLGARRFLIPAMLAARTDVRLPPPPAIPAPMPIELPCAAYGMACAAFGPAYGMMSPNSNVSSLSTLS